MYYKLPGPFGLVADGAEPLHRRGPDEMSGPLSMKSCSLHQGLGMFGVWGIGLRVYRVSDLQLSLLCSSLNYRRPSSPLKSSYWPPRKLLK